MSCTNHVSLIISVIVTYLPITSISLPHVFDGLNLFIYIMHHPSMDYSIQSKTNFLVLGFPPSMCCHRGWTINPLGKHLPSSGGVIGIVFNVLFVFSYLLSLSSCLVWFDLYQKCCCDFAMCYNNLAVLLQFYPMHVVDFVCSMQLYELSWFHKIVHPTFIELLTMMRCC